MAKKTTMQRVDDVLIERLEQLRKDYEQLYGPISIVDISRIFGDLGDLDLKKLPPELQNHGKTRRRGPCLTPVLPK